MTQQSYLPSAEADPIEGLSNYRAKIPTHGPVVGLSATEISGVGWVRQGCHNPPSRQIGGLRCVGKVWGLTGLFAPHLTRPTLWQSWNPAVQQYAQAATAYKNLIANGEGNPPLPAITTPTAQPPVSPADVLNRLAAQIARFKTHAGYTETIGRDLGVIATASNSDHPSPDFSANVETGASSQVVRLNFTKYGHDGVWIESRRNGGNWEFLAIDTVKPYIDDRPLLTANTAETREYRMRWWDKGQANGDWTAVQSLAVGA